MLAPLFSKAKVAAGRRRREPGQALQTYFGFCWNHFQARRRHGATSAFTRDIGNEFIIGKEYNELDLDDFNIGSFITSTGAGVFWHTTNLSACSVPPRTREGRTSWLDYEEGR